MLLTEALTTRGYDICQFLGRGGYATVYKVNSAKYPNLSFVAKVMGENHKYDLKTIKMLYEREVSILKIAVGYNIIKLYDHFLIDNYFVIILEYCSKGSLDKHIMKCTINKSSLYQYFRDLITAVYNLHINNIAHCDIKPANILIDEYNRLKLTDFGLAEKFECNEATPKSGTLAFCAPEIIKLKKYDPFKTDIWSLGVTLYYIAFGRHPFEAKTAEEYKKSILSKSLATLYIYKNIDFF